jgi:hypothetical protein
MASIFFFRLARPERPDHCQSVDTWRSACIVVQPAYIHPDSCLKSFAQTLWRLVRAEGLSPILRSNYVQENPPKSLERAAFSRKPT